MKDRAWRPEQALTISDALGAFLDHLEDEFAHDVEEELPPDPLPLSTGVAALDHVLGGGVHVGTVTTLEASLAAQADALLYSVARRIERRTLLDAGSVLETVRWLVAGESEVPAVALTGDELSERDWSAVASAMRPLADRDLVVSEIETLRTLERLIATSDVDVVLVQELDRFGPPASAAAALARIAAAHAVAILVSTRPLGEIPGSALSRIERVLVCDHCLGSKASLVHPDPFDLLRVAAIDIECLTGTAG